MGTDSEEDDLPINLEENGTKFIWNYLPLSTLLFPMSQAIHMVFIFDSGKVAPGPVTAKPALGNANAVKAKKSAEKPKVSAEAAKGKEKGGDSDEDDDDDEDGSAEDDSDDEVDSSRSYFLYENIVCFHRDSNKHIINSIVYLSILETCWFTTYI